MFPNHHLDSNLWPPTRATNRVTRLPCIKSCVEKNSASSIYFVGEFDDEIRCVLEIRPPDIKTAYEALSYHWGDDSNLKTTHILHLRHWQGLAFEGAVHGYNTPLYHLAYDTRALIWRFDLSDRERLPGHFGSTLCVSIKRTRRKSEYRFNAIYANAWQVVVWFGGYHGITAENSACSEADYCLQRHQIEKAFYVCTGLGSWRFVYSWLFNLDMVFAEQAVADLIDIDKRGWWERLWVIQEMALAIGRVLLQCGKGVGHYNLYCAMRLKMIERFDNMIDLQRTSAVAMQAFVEITESFRYPEDLLPTGSLIRLWLVQLISRAAGQERRQQFRKQKLALRLQYILLSTSGHFKCRDVQDRLLGHDNTRFQLVALRRGLTRLHILLFIWDQSYTWIAQYWPIFRPQFVIKDQKEVHEAIARSSRDSHDKAQFLHGPGTVSGNSNRQIIVPTACLTRFSKRPPGHRFGPDLSIRMPMYLPSVRTTYLLKSSTSAQIQELFTLQGRTRGTINVVHITNTSQPDHTQPLQRVFEIWLYLPMEFKITILVISTAVFRNVSATRRTATIALMKRWFAAGSPEGTIEHQIRTVRLTDWDRNYPAYLVWRLFFKAVWRKLRHGHWRRTRVRMVWFAFVLALSFPGIHYAINHLESLRVMFRRAMFSMKNRGQDTTLVYSFDARAGEMGVLKAGEAVPDDQLWRLAGLVAMGPKGGLERTACTEAQWEQHKRDGALQEYLII
ncbi:LOW QUALITY PROTEIN: hypothetical protein QC761_512575 [Podospora bellae-mahoneyi]|uniref:Heterokaryon incompatibility domain-containing protein n=1 Tax=Podospora bellae-mahoneyi TaxID=2093777 RepID=A0ABR0FCE5_9PEZI|nr:LOW QUALITY PROTEIN: hypothetical protein QC761_512575 [Podospora bellae-mahoneyi]